MFEHLLLASIHKINGERSLPAVYHLLTGKRSSQTLQDARIFDLAGFFGLCKSLVKEDFNRAIMELNENGKIQIREGAATVKEKGIACLSKSAYKEPFEQFNGLVYDRSADLIYQRLTIFVQTATNIYSGNKFFIPVIENEQTLLWFKSFYRKHNQELKKWIDALYEELSAFLQKIPDMDAGIFVDRLTGYSRIGLSMEQLAVKYQIEKLDVHLRWLLTVHALLNHIADNQDKYPYLSVFADGLFNDFFLTDSAKKTYELLQKGYSIPAVAKIRKLKENTIHDHIVEVAYASPQFPLERFLTNKEVEEIVGMAKKLNTRRLKEIQLALDNKYKYFQLRLALAVKRSDWLKEQV
ncbi:helix-turn-helix domain-containing protein [Sediminibacillus massiliensis]|uniref:helix-turn-helix domain-containing protein n=1 Tax=Sediminibacillus massiliensis TaxID=1926277 RepID=UPI0009884622|nr:helix-turn-helix domain-containing protein [Sediminibacillus massiliensis]